MDNLLKALGLVLYIALLPLLGFAEILIDLIVFIPFDRQVQSKRGSNY
jgi:hypothetical protein